MGTTKRLLEINDFLSFRSHTLSSVAVQPDLQFIFFFFFHRRNDFVKENGGN